MAQSNTNVIAVECFFAAIEDGKGRFIVKSGQDKLSRFGLNTRTLRMKPTAGGAQHVGRDVIVHIAPTYYQYELAGKTVSGMRPIAKSINLPK